MPGEEEKIAAETAIRVAGLSKRYAAQPVLEGLDLAVRQGEFFGLVGVNGAGKTTLIKCLLDFCDVDAGTVELFGIPHTENGARGRVAFLPERFLPPYFLRGREFLDYMGRLHGVRFSRQSIEQTFAALDLAPAALERPVRQFSKGMAQKLGIAACILSGKDLYLLDEPMSGLDPRARALLKRQLARLKDDGKTMFFSTHLLADIDALCDRMAVLHGGKVRFVGSPAELREEYGSSDLEQAYMACIESDTGNEA